MKEICCDNGKVGERHFCTQAGEEVNVPKIDKLPSIYSDDAPPHMQMRILWNKMNELVDFINNKENEI